MSVETTPPSPGRFLAADAGAGDGRQNVDEPVAIDAVAKVGRVEIERRARRGNTNRIGETRRASLGSSGSEGMCPRKRKPWVRSFRRDLKAFSSLLAEPWGNPRRRSRRPGNEFLDGALFGSVTVSPPSAGKVCGCL